MASKRKGARSDSQVRAKKSKAKSARKRAMKMSEKDLGSHQLPEGGGRVNKLPHSGRSGAYLGGGRTSAPPLSEYGKAQRAKRRSPNAPRGRDYS